jgi:signal peptidase II
LQAAGGTAITISWSRASKKHIGIAAAIALLGVLVDFGTKVAALAWLEPGNFIPLLGGLLILRLTRNSGAAFSMGESFTPVFTCFAIAALCVILCWLLPKVRHVGWAVTTGLLLAGISGNLFDRLFREPGPFRGEVIDFIQLPYFAIFNVADICITAAAVLVIWLSVIRQVSPGGASLRQDA